MRVLHLRVCSPPAPDPLSPSFANVCVVSLASSKLVCHKPPNLLNGCCWQVVAHVLENPFGLSLGISLLLLTCLVSPLVRHMERELRVRQPQQRWPHPVAFSCALHTPSQSISQHMERGTEGGLGIISQPQQR